MTVRSSWKIQLPLNPSPALLEPILPVNPPCHSFPEKSIRGKWEGEVPCTPTWLAQSSSTKTDSLLLRKRLYPAAKRFMTVSEMVEFTETRTMREGVYWFCHVWVGIPGTGS